MRLLPILPILGVAASVCAFGEVRLLTGDANNRTFDRDAFILDISTDGKLVLFVSGAPSNGSPSPGVQQGGLYIRNLAANTLAFTGATHTGVEGSLSDDGRFVSWTSPNNVIYWRDCHDGITRLITPDADGASRNPILSADGRFVAYASVARNIVPDPAKLPAPGRAAVYVYDSVTEQTKIASLTYQSKALSTGVGLTAPQFEFDFSADGRYIVFSTDAADVHPSRGSATSQAYYWTYRRNLMRGGIDVVSKNAAGEIPNGNFTSPRINATGSRILFAGGFVGLGGGPTLVPGYNGMFASDLYLKDLPSGEVWRITKTVDNSSPDGALTAGGAINADGSVVAFGSSSTKLVQENTDPGGRSSMDIFRVDVGAAGAVTTTLITKAVQGPENVDFLTGPFLPGTGDYVAFVTGNLKSMVGQSTDNAVFKHGVGVGSFPASEARPSLGARLNSQQVTLSWPDTSDYSPEFTTDLQQNSWQPITQSPALNNGLKSVSLPADGRSKFIRLRQTAE